MGIFRPNCYQKTIFDINYESLNTPWSNLRKVK